MNNHSYVLFYPSIELGGAEILFARLGDQLANRGNSVTILDSDNKVIINNISNKDIKTIVLQDDLPVHVSCDYIIAFSSHILSIPKYIDASSCGKLLFWNIHPLNNIYLPPVLGPKLFHLGLGWLKLINYLLFSSEDRVRKVTLQTLLQASAFVCMDGENANTLNKYYNTNTRFDLIPIPVYANTYYDSHKIKLQIPISLFWYGRLCDFKSHSLVYLIEKISELKRSSPPVRLTVIGDGPYRSFIEKTATKRGVKVSFIGSLPNSESIELLKNEASAVFAMGTAALEAGALGIPTILAGASFGPIKLDYRFDWLYNTSNFTLGIFVKKDINSNGLTFIELLHELQNNLYTHAYMSQQYVKINHNIDHVVDLVEKHAALSKMHFHRIALITKYKRPLLNRIAKYCKNQFAIFTNIH